MQRPAVALETVAQRRQRSVDVHPLAQVAENLLAGLRPVKGLQLGPLFLLGLANESQHRFRKHRTLAVEALATKGGIAVL